MITFEIASYERGNDCAYETKSGFLYTIRVESLTSQEILDTTTYFDALLIAVASAIHCVS